MTRYLGLAEVLKLHSLIIAETGGSHGLRDLGLLESALGQPRQTLGGEDLYPNLVAKAAALGFSLIKNHPFIDGNKRIGHAAVEAMFMLNGFETSPSIEREVADRESLPRAWRPGDSVPSTPGPGTSAPAMTR